MTDETQGPTDQQEAALNDLAKEVFAYIEEKNPRARFVLVLAEPYDEDRTFGTTATNSAPGAAVDMLRESTKRLLSHLLADTLVNALFGARDEDEQGEHDEQRSKTTT